jgi:glycosyltransferase involved in cell wall biosynthesis
MRLRKVFFRILKAAIVLTILPFLVIVALISRFRNKKIDVGLGPEPLINNVYHKKALEHWGYSAETFVAEVYFITDQFDIRADRILFDGTKSIISRFFTFFNYLYLSLLSIWRYKCIYIYFNGGPLGLLAWDFPVLKAVEPLIYKLANVKVVVMPYGGDVQDLTRTPNLLFRHFMTESYPTFRFSRQIVVRQIDLWTRHADHVISGCDWVDYMYHWDTLMLAHFSIDVELWVQPLDVRQKRKRTLQILHAPNHRAIKGTNFFIRAVEELKAEGLDVELVLVEQVPNEKIREIMASVDIIADQLIIGWYAMFALEGMAMGKPVLCYLRPDLENLYTVAGLIRPGEIPVVNCTPHTVKEAIRDLILNPYKLPEIGGRSREFVIHHHSIESVGKIFDQINRSLGIVPTHQKV